MPAVETSTREEVETGEETTTPDVDVAKPPGPDDLPQPMQRKLRVPMVSTNKLSRSALKTGMVKAAGTTKRTTTVP